MTPVPMPMPKTTFDDTVAGPKYSAYQRQVPFVPESFHPPVDGSAPEDIALAASFLFLMCPLDSRENGVRCGEPKTDNSTLATSGNLDGNAEDVSHTYSDPSARARTSGHSPVPGKPEDGLLRSLRRGVLGSGTYCLVVKPKDGAPSRGV